MLVSTVGSILNKIENTLSEREFDPEVYQHEFVVCTLDYGEAVLMPRIMERIMAEAPGITRMVQPAAIAALTTRNPGSLITGIPASDTRATFAPVLSIPTMPCALARSLWSRQANSLGG